MLKENTAKLARLKSIWIGLLWLSWAFWWGGLSFYAGIVVPIGSELIGSVDQGFITQKVTYWHNLFFSGFIILLAIEGCCRRSARVWAVVALLVLINAALFYFHSRLSSQLDFSEQSVPEGFYSQHARYLWITTAEWMIGLAVPLCFWNRRSEECRSI